MPIFEDRREYGSALSLPQLLKTANPAVTQSRKAVLQVALPASEANPPETQDALLPAPTAGIKDGLLNLDSSRTALSAIEMRNFWPTDRGLEVRKGSEILYDFGAVADLAGVGINEPLALISNEESREVLAFYTDVTYVYNIDTGVFRRENEVLTVRDVSFVLQRVEKGTILVVVNGVDPMFIYNGTDITRINRFLIDQKLNPIPQYLNTNELESVWLFGGRIFFAHRASNSVFYLGINSVPVDDDTIPQASEFPMGNVFPERGRVFNGYSWSVDVGDDFNNRCVFASTVGDLAIYSGDPDLDFNLDGVYKAGVPLSKTAAVSVGGDVYALMHHGFKSVLEIVQGREGGGEPYSLEEGSFESLRRELRIDALGTLEANQINRGSHAVKYLRQLDMLIMAHMRGDTREGMRDDKSAVVAYNTRLKAWGPFTGWNIRAMDIFGGSRLLFLDEKRRLIRAWSGSSDGWSSAPPVVGVPYTAFSRNTFSTMGGLSLSKTVDCVQTIWDTSDRIFPLIKTIGYSNEIELPDPPSYPDIGPDGVIDNTGDLLGDLFGWVYWVESGILSLSVADVTVTEASGVARFRITLSDASEGEVTFDVVTVEGTALADVDYTPVSANFIIPAGQTFIDIPVTILVDDVDENNETFDLVISQPIGAVILDGRGTCTITESGEEDEEDGDEDGDFGHTVASLDIRFINMLGSLTYKVGVGVGADGFSIETIGTSEFVELDGEGHDIAGKRVPIFVAFDFLTAFEIAPTWAAYVMTNDDIVALEAAGEVISAALRPPAHSVRGWRALNVQIWDTDDGRPEGYTFPDASVISSPNNLTVGELLPQQGLSPYLGHAIGVSSIFGQAKGAWLSWQGELWVHDRANNGIEIGPHAFDPFPIVYNRRYVLFRPWGEVNAVTSQIAQDFGNLEDGARGLVHFYVDRDDGDSEDIPSPFQDIASSQLVGRWYNAVMSVTQDGIFGPVLYRWGLESAVSTPQNVAPDATPADYDRG